MRALVMGTGHSGSRYLRDMIIKFGFEVIHEISKKFRDGKYLEDCDWEGAANWLNEKDRRVLCGYPYGFMIYYLRHVVGDVRVICVHRPLEQWKVRGSSGPIDKAASYPRGLTSHEHYWNIYENLMNSVTPPVLHLEMKDLNSCSTRVREFIS